MWHIDSVRDNICYGYYTKKYVVLSDFVHSKLACHGDFFFFFQFWLCWVFIVVGRLHCLMACGSLVPQPGIKPMFSALEGRFLTTGPPGKSCHRHLILSSGSGLQFQAMLLESG